ncbi:tRNA dimethylallyltransferase [Clostridia bacterium]|nr:tRNA dimethylallyltransferase [Clostridia bacterium]
MYDLIVISGATATGKTAAAVSLAEKINGEIISADSMQVYKYMDIGTAKPDKETLSRVKHYMIDECYPDEEFSVSLFAKKSKIYMEEIRAKGKTPILVGGTGFYINAVLFDTDFTPTDTDYAYRNYLYELAEKKGADCLFEILEKVDPDSGIHKNNIKKVVRALEYFHQTNTPISEHNKTQRAKKSPYSYKFIVLDLPREEIYKNINARVDKMLEEGLVREVQTLLGMGYGASLTSMQGLGYKEIVKYLDGASSLSESAELLKQSTRHFAKRQITWFKHKSPADAVWTAPQNFTFKKSGGGPPQCIL